MADLSELFAKAREAQSRLQVLQRELAGRRVEGSAGGGMVNVTLSGRKECRKVRIDPSMLSDQEMLEDLIVAAFNDGKAKVEAMVSEKMAEITGGLNLPPGMKLPFLSDAVRRCHGIPRN